MESIFSEVYNVSFVGKRDLDLLRYSREDKKRLIELENSISNEYQYLRPSLLEGLIKNVTRNQRNFQDEDLQFFEIGTIFVQEKEKEEAAKEKEKK